jgi:hypothetical protein
MAQLAAKTTTIKDYNRLSKDRERLPATSVALVRIAFIRVMRRLDAIEREWANKQCQI